MWFKVVQNDCCYNFQIMSLPGKPVSILTINPDESFTLDEDALKTVLSSNEIKNKPICLVPVAGQFSSTCISPFHLWKSFFMMCCFLNRSISKRKILLIELHAPVPRGRGIWKLVEESKSEELEGFHWCGGSERDTTGILIWSKVFTMRTESGQDVAVVLMDTQVPILKT